MGSLLKSLSLYPPNVLNHNNHQGEDDVNWAIGVNCKLLKFLGLWSCTDKNRWQTIKSNFQIVCIGVAIFAVNIFPQTLALVKIWGNLPLMVDNLIIYIPNTAAEFKLIVPWTKKKVLAKIFEDIRADWLEKRNSEERDVMIKFATTGKLITICGLCLAYFSVAFYMGPIFFGTVLRTVTNLTDNSDVLLPVQAIYLYDITTPSRYYFTLGCQIMCSAFSATIYSTMDILFGVVVLHACGQLEILAKKIEKMADDNENIRQSLKIYLQRHYQLIGFVKRIEQLFNMMLLALFASVIISFCVLELSLITVLSSDSADVPMMHIICDIQFLFTFTFLMFIYSWVGENLITQSEAIYTAVCNTNWVKCDYHDSIQLVLLLTRSQYPLFITAGKLVSIRLPTFVTLLKTSIGYASVLRAIKE